MSKRENDANNAFRPSDSPLTEHEKEQIALRKNMERLKAERLAREAANAPKQKGGRIPKERSCSSLSPTEGTEAPRSIRGAHGERCCDVR